MSVEPQLDKGYDQVVLNSLVWPDIRDVAAIFDSYNCREVEKYGQARPWPTRRQGQSVPLVVDDQAGPLLP